MTNVPDITEPADEPEDHRPDGDAQIRELSSRAVESLGRYQPMSLAKVSPAIEEMMRNILAHQHLNLGDQLNSAVVKQLFENSSALKVARESLSDLVSANFAPRGRFAPLVNFSALAAAKSSSDPKLYPAPELDEPQDVKEPSPRKRNSPRAFFGKHAVTVRTIPEYLNVVAAIQGNYRGRRLVWRGQQNADWPVQSSLHRHLLEEEQIAATEENLVGYEKRAFASAAQWGIPAMPAMGFLSKLQHNGAPTRLLDISRDPNAATWFAVEHAAKLVRKPARVIVWALDQEDPELPTEADDLFWHEWGAESLRRKFDWGTGTRMWPWFPPAAGNERMRAQRAGFLIGASSIVTTPVADLYSEYFEEDWNTTEITNATSFLGVPVPFDREPDDDNRIPADLRAYVPFITIHIPAPFKRTLRAYLEDTAGLDAATIYPDFAGLVRELRTPPAS